MSGSDRKRVRLRRFGGNFWLQQILEKIGEIRREFISPKWRHFKLIRKRMNDFEGDRAIFIAAFTAHVAYLNILIFIEYNKNQILEARAEAKFEPKKRVIV